MSITKPGLKNPWASSGSLNMEDPGGVNETGYPSAAKGPPRKWFNWILNKIETTSRYLVGRGLPDYDTNESYSVGDRVQYGGAQGLTFACTTATVGDGSGSNNPIASPSLWARWARSLPDYHAGMNYQIGDCVFAPSDGLSYRCIQANGVSSAKEPHANPTYWERWGHSDQDIVDSINTNTPIATQTSSGTMSGIGVTTGTVTNVMDIRTGYATVVRDLSFTLGGIPSSPGYVDVTLSSPIAFGSKIMNSQVTGAVTPSVGTAAYGEIIGNNQVRVHARASSGPNATAYVRLLGY